MTNRWERRPPRMLFRCIVLGFHLRTGRLKFKPEEGVRRESKDVWGGGDGGEWHVPQHFDRFGAFVARQVKGDGLRKAAEIGYTENRLMRSVVVPEVAKIGEDFAV